MEAMTYGSYQGSSAKIKMLYVACRLNAIVFKFYIVKKKILFCRKDVASNNIFVAKIRLKCLNHLHYCCKGKII